MLHSIVELSTAVTALFELEMSLSVSLHAEGVVQTGGQLGSGTKQRRAPSQAKPSQAAAHSPVHAGPVHSFAHEHELTLPPPLPAAPFGVYRLPPQFGRSQLFELDDVNPAGQAHEPALSEP